MATNRSLLGPVLWVLLLLLAASELRGEPSSAEFQAPRSQRPAVWLDASAGEGSHQDSQWNARRVVGYGLSCEDRSSTPSVPNRPYF
jgi:hypothetical protein